VAPVAERQGKRRLTAAEQAEADRIIADLLAEAVTAGGDDSSPPGEVSAALAPAGGAGLGDAKRFVQEAAVKNSDPLHLNLRFSGKGGERKGR